MKHPGDVSSLGSLLDSGELDARDIKAVIGKTEGNGGVNDFTRGYFTQSLMALLSRHTGISTDELLRTVPCVLSGGTEGVLTPHYLVLSRTDAGDTSGRAVKALAIGTAMSKPTAPEEIGRFSHVESIAAAVRVAMSDADITTVEDVHFVQVKAPCVTAPRAAAATARGRSVLNADSNRSMADARIAGAFGVAIALGEISSSAAPDLLARRDPAVFSSRASISSGVEVECNEVIVLGNSAAWSGDLQISHRLMRDALDIGAVVDVLGELGIGAMPQVADRQSDLIRAVLVKCEPDRRGAIRGRRHTMLDDTDINAQRHIRGAVGGLVAGVCGDTRIFLSGGAEHQGPDGGGLIAVIAASGGREGRLPCAS